MPYEQKAEALRLWREAAAQGSAEAYYEIYEHHKSWDRGHPERPQSVTRAEAAEALRKAAELGHPLATRMLIRRLTDGDIVKRDPDGRTVLGRARRRQPRNGRSRANMSLTLGSLLAASDKPEERARGLDILERIASGPYVFGAKRELANAIRKNRSGARPRTAGRSKARRPRRRHRAAGADADIAAKAARPTPGARCRC